jgi:hypothetical protein
MDTTPNPKPSRVKDIALGITLMPVFAVIVLIGVVAVKLNLVDFNDPPLPDHYT